MHDMTGDKLLALRALSGEPTDRVPVALFTWGFEYLWRVAGIEPWQLACGSHETWHSAHMALIDRHAPDLILYEGCGSGPQQPRLLEENGECWVVQDENTARRYSLLKDSLTLVDLASGRKGCDPVGSISSEADADNLVQPFKGWGEDYLNGLRRLIREAGNRALVMPHHSPAYICACYAFGFESAMETIVRDPDLFHHVCRMFQAGDRFRMREWADAGAEAVFIADGWASCDVLSPGMVKDMALPYQRSITDAAHEAGLHIVMWSEGNILPILAMEAEIPFDAFAFEQPRKGAEITVGKVRQGFGKERCLFGNVDSEMLLLQEDRNEIEQAVQMQIRESGKGAPFVLSTGSPLPSNIAPAAVDMMIEAARLNGKQLLGAFETQA